MQSVHDTVALSPGPITASERLPTLDVLRGFALFGVLISNIWFWFSGATFLMPGLLTELRQVSLDSIAFYVVGIFISGKAITTFSFLFGLGFAVQMLRAESRGTSVVPLFSRRLAVMFVLGAVHAVLLWYGDILTQYAVLGTGLLLFRRRAQRTLLVWAVVFLALIPLASASVPLVMSVTTTSPAAAAESETDEAEQRNREMLARFTSGDPASVIEGNLLMLRRFHLAPQAINTVSLFGLFLLGLYVGRARIFEHAALYGAQMKKIVIWGAAIGLLGALGSAAMRVSIDPEAARALPWLPLAFTLLDVPSTTPFAAAYICAATLLLQRPRWRAPLGLFAPAGRMALTNYLSQTVICLAIYYGGGLIGGFHAALGIAIAVMIFAAQMWWSAWWLERFHFGPMEWLWRSLTYGRFQPMRLPRRSPVTVQVG